MYHGNHIRYFINTVQIPNFGAYFEHPQIQLPSPQVVNSLVLLNIYAMTRKSLCYFGVLLQDGKLAELLIPLYVGDLQARQ